jgi:hypothetical protein
MDIFLDNQEGITVRELRKIIGRIEETDEDGNDARVFIVSGNLHTSPLKIAAQDEDGDLVLVSEFWQAVMEDLESWEDFIE